MGEFAKYMVIAAGLLLPVMAFAGTIAIDENGNGVGTLGAGF